MKKTSKTLSIVLVVAIIITFALAPISALGLNNPYDDDDQMRYMNEVGLSFVVGNIWVAPGSSLTDVFNATMLEAIRQGATIPIYYFVVTNAGVLVYDLSESSVTPDATYTDITALNTALDAIFENVDGYYDPDEGLLDWDGDSFGDDDNIAETFKIQGFAFEDDDEEELEADEDSIKVDDVAFDADDFEFDDGESYVITFTITDGTDVTEYTATYVADIDDEDSIVTLTATVVDES